MFKQTNKHGETEKDTHNRDEKTQLRYQHKDKYLPWYKIHMGVLHSQTFPSIPFHKVYTTAAPRMPQPAGKTVEVDRINKQGILMSDETDQTFIQAYQISIRSLYFPTDI